MFCYSLCLISFLLYTLVHTISVDGQEKDASSAVKSRGLWQKKTSVTTVSMDADGTGFGGQGYWLLCDIIQ